MRATALIDAPQDAVHRAAGRTDVWTRTARAMGARAELARPVHGPSAPLRTGDLIRFRREPHRGGLLPGRSLILRVHRDSAADLPGFDLLAGPLSSCAISLFTTPTTAGTSVTIDFRVRAAPAVLTPLLRKRVLYAAQLLLGILALAAQEVQVVVAGAIVRESTVLAARRTTPSELAGRWELPGGKVIPGETEQRALARELEEELELKVSVGRRIGDDVDLGGNQVLRCFEVEIETGEPMPTEHDAVTWVSAGDLDSVDWLPSDRELLPALRALLTS